MLYTVLYRDEEAAELNIEEFLDMVKKAIEVENNICREILVPETQFMLINTLFVL